MRAPSAVAALIPILALHGAAQSVYVSRMWHNHQPLYWPEWNRNGSQTDRVEFAWDSIVLKPGRNYSGSGSRHPENNLTDIFGLDDRRAAYQGRPRDSLAACPQAAGFCVSYSGSLIDNVRQLGGGGHLGYGPGWWDGNRTARNWTTPAGSRRLDLVGFTYHHSLAPLLPKSVLRKEIQIFKQAWWKAWGGNSNLSDHSKGFFPTEMAFSRHIIDVLAEEGYEWVIVPSHHLSRTCPTYFNQFDLGGNNYGIFSSPPNRADLLGPSPTGGWWYGQPNPGNAAWNVSPFAYQLHRAEYIHPATGSRSSILLVPSDDVLSYRYGYADEGTGKIAQFIAPHATDPARPVIVMPSTDGDNAWGGGFSSWMEATPGLFNGGYAPTAVQDFVNAHGGAAGTVHIEDGAWIFPESCYGSPNFLKWIEPPVAASPATRYPGTVVDMETPGFALKFWSWAPVVTGANWVETAEQVLRDEGGSVEPWRIQAPYDWDGTPTNPNEVELAWHIYLGGLDSGFNYYGGLGNDDEVKPALATTRAIEKLQPWFTPARRANDRTPPSVLKPQRFPYNPGSWTFGWFNSIPGGDTRYLKKMPSEFYIWTHAYDLSGIASVNLKVRIDANGANPLASTQNETYAGGGEVGPWVTIPMTVRELPDTPSELNAAASNGQINYFITPPELADYHFARISDATLPGFRGKLLDYHIEATDSRGNVHRSEIQHVFVEDDDAGTPVDPPATPAGLAITGTTATTVSLDWNDTPAATSYRVFRNGTQIANPTESSWLDTGLMPSSTHSYTITAVNAGGASPSAGPVQATTGASSGPVPFILDGSADFPGYLLSSPGMTIHAALRGSVLYLATWAPGQYGNDHFLFLAPSLGTTAGQPSPWAKAGTTALPANAPFVGAESSNSYIGWFNTGGTPAQAIRGPQGGQMEATIDLAAAFGSLPAVVHLAAAAYQTGDAGILGSQGPAPVNANGNLDPEEFLSLPTEVLRDENADGLYDRLDPGQGFRITSFMKEHDGLTLRWNAFPGRSYRIESTSDPASPWSTVPGTEVTAPAMATELQATLPAATGERRFFRVVLSP